MSLSSLLLPKKVALDSELDGLFKIPIANAPIAGPSKKNVTKKRKLDPQNLEIHNVPPKRIKESTDEKTSKLTTESKKGDEKVKKRKASTKGKGKEVEEEDDDEDDDRLESAYLEGKKSMVPEKTGDDEAEHSDNDGNLDKLVNESLTKKDKKIRAPKTKYVPSEETAEQRDQRTIFVGNLPVEVASKKPLQKQLKNHIVASIPSAKIESIRFRSIPFQAPTTKLEGESEDPKKKVEPSKKEPRVHEKERASVWRSKLDGQDEDNMSKDEKRYLNPSQKKKIAFINQEFHSSADTINAYIVFAHPPNTEGRAANLPPLPPTMDPYQAALNAAQKCNGTMFMERMLRVDLATQNKPSALTTSSGETTVDPSVMETDPRLSIFVGNLDFASKEEDLRVFFETLMVAEKGAPPKNDNDDKPSTWVTRVRVVRDKDTQLGKGFAYLQFTDRECIDELLALEQDKLKFAKRKLRVQRCKSSPGNKQVVTQHKERTPAVVMPKGDPRLGEKLSGLPKEERKQIKSSDADRVARRLAKKKARMSMAPGIGKANKPKGKDRKRVR